MGKRYFKNYICRPYCTFFKEDQKENLVCQGAHVIEQLVKRGRLDPEQLPRKGKDPRLGRKHDTTLDTYVCQHCPFKVQDCEFQAEVPPAHAEPCGGYILLTLLIGSSFITPTDLEEASLK